VLATDWGRRNDSIYSVDLLVDATDRQGLLRDISDVLSREKINVTAVKTQSRNGSAHMAFTVEVDGGAVLQKTLVQLCAVAGVTHARRA
jgi:GTP pyrophosphokinase